MPYNKKRQGQPGVKPCPECPKLNKHEVKAHEMPKMAKNHDSKPYKMA